MRAMNALEGLAEHGQSVWLDNIRRSTTRQGALARRLDEGLRGLASSPSDFEQALASDDAYGEALQALVASADRDAGSVYEAIAVEDIREAADALRPVYDRTQRADGYVSLQVAPSLARDPDGTIEHARRLWAAVGRPNVMLEVPGTPEGLPAIEALLSEGINVNVTLVFSRGAYHSIADVFVVGAERWIASGGDPGQLASVASFCVGRIDTEVDHRLAIMLERTQDPAHRAELQSLLGTAALANAKLAYEIYQRMLAAPRWRALADRGARPQRLSWTSTDTSNPAYADIKYVQPLIGPDTVTTLSPATLAAFGTHGSLATTLTQGVPAAREVLQRLEALGLSMGEVTDTLLERGIEQFEDAMDALLGTIAQHQRRHRGTRLNRLHASLPAALADAVGNAHARWNATRGTQRLWDRDATLWSTGDEAQGLGWLDIVDTQRKRVEYFGEIARMFGDRDIQDVVVLGMGGCSLAPEVLARVFGVDDDFPRLSVLDTTDPTQILATQHALALEKTLFIVSSKSGTTLETRLLLRHFYACMQAAVGDAAPRHFVAITDADSPLEAFAREQGFWTIQHGVPDIGGRFSVFSNVGMVPAAAMGLPVIDFLEEAALMVGACGSVPAGDNPGVALGLILGAAAARGRDKLTLITTPAIAPLGPWLEALVAESTGKRGKAIVPHEREPLLDADAYADDRLFVYLRLQSTPHLDQDRAVDSLAQAGHPVVRLDLDDAWSVAQEFFRWQVATVVAASVLGVDPFDQPDVEASKVETRALLDGYERSGVLPGESPLWSGDGILLFADDKLATTLRNAVGDAPTLAAWLRAYFGRMRPRDYVALLAYLPMTVEHERLLHDLRSVVLEATAAATCVGFGPRFLHATGQAYKGGPNSGLFVQLTGHDAADLPVAEHRYSFGVVKAAQARGDFQVLSRRGRRVLRVHLADNVHSGLQTLLAAVEAALAGHRERTQD